MDHNLCVLIDFENIAAGTEKEGHGRFDITAVLRRLKDKGRILVARSYGDWGRFARFKQSLLQEGVTMVELTSYRGQDKNRADIALVVDAMELAFTRDYIDTFVLLSGDSDFTPLILRLKEMNKRVIGIGTRGSTSRLIIEASDEFIFYESLKKTDRTSRTPRAERDHGEDSAPSLTREQAFSLLVETLEGLQKEAPGSIHASIIKASILRKHPAFDEGEYGFRSFARFVEKARADNLVSLSRDARGGGYRVDLPGEGGDTLETEEPRAFIDDALPTLPEEAERLRVVLANEGIHPVTPMIRHIVVHEFVEHIQERMARKRRNTMAYTISDIARRCRKTDPPVAPRHVRAVITSLFGAGQLIHPDGDPVRSFSAPFHIHKDAEALLDALKHHYVKALAKVNADLSDAGALSQLLWNDDAHVEQVTNLLAEVNSAQEEQSPSSDTPPTNDADTDEGPTSSPGATEDVVSGTAEISEDTPAEEEVSPSSEAPNEDPVTLDAKDIQADQPEDGASTEDVEAKKAAPQDEPAKPARRRRRVAPKAPAS